MFSRNCKIVSKRVRSGRSWIQLGLVGKKDKVVYIFIHFNRKAIAGNQEPHSLAQLCGTKWQGSHLANSEV